MGFFATILLNPRSPALLNNQVSTCSGLSQVQNSLELPVLQEM